MCEESKEETATMMLFYHCGGTVCSFYEPTRFSFRVMDKFCTANVEGRRWNCKIS
jgi:hypothetical protein